MMIWYVSIWKTGQNYPRIIIKYSTLTSPQMTDLSLILTLLITANLARASSIVNQTPMSWARSATGLLVSQTNFWASSLISTQLFSKANKGASGKAATNIVIKPNCNTERNNIINLKENDTVSGETILLKLFSLPSEKISYLKWKNLLEQTAF